MKTKINFENNEISFLLNTKIYSRGIIYKTCYVFIDRMYIYLDNPKKDEILVFLKGKKELKKQELEKLKGEFSNELLNTILRENLTKQNQKVLEYIVGGAINASLEKSEQDNKEKDVESVNIEKEIALLKKELEEMEGEDYEKDSLGIKKIADSNTKKAKKK